MDGEGVQIMSIDNLPTELPLEASKYFSENLLPYVKLLVRSGVSPFFFPLYFHIFLLFYFFKKENERIIHSSLHL